VSGPRRRRYHGPDRGPRPVSESLDRAVDRLTGPGGAGGVRAAGGGGENDRARAADTAAPAALFTRWDEIAGELAAHARPVRLAQGVLVVAVDHPARATAVRAQAGALLQRARAVTGVPAERLSVTVQRP
jgi:Dna[CI] antecedent, DciA